MSDMRNDGGPAFPSHFNTAVREGAGGMKLRDYFAAHADIGDVDELTTVVGEKLVGRAAPLWQDDAVGCLQWWADYRSMLRYIEADAMLKARQQ